MTQESGVSDDMLQSVLRALLQVADRTLEAAHSVSNGVMTSPGVAPASRRAHDFADQVGDLAGVLGGQFNDVADQLGDRVSDFGGFTTAIHTAVPAGVGERAAAMSGAAAELVSALSANRSMVEDVIRAEIEGQLHRVGLASENELAVALDEIDRLRAENQRLQRALAQDAQSQPRPTPTTGPGTPSRPVVSRAALREAAQRQSAAADVAAAPAKKATAKKTAPTAKKATAKKTAPAAKKATVQQATGTTAAAPEGSAPSS